ncbi:MAG TPA: hypothetical protein VL122_03555 [Nitrospirota bacterium]|nr:hypothetical protein [Nitrospirota bacterium]
MATANVLNEKGYLLEVYRELEDIKERINRLRKDLAATYGREGTVFMTHERHLLEIADYIDWKLQILEKGTGFDWKAAGEKDVESIVSVRSPELGTGPDFSGGYVGG